MVENVLRIVQPTKPFPLTQSEVFNRDPDTVRAECISQWQTVYEPVCSYECTKSTRFCTQMKEKGPDIIDLIDFILDHSFKSQRARRQSMKREWKRRKDQSS